MAGDDRPRARGADGPAVLEHAGAPAAPDTAAGAAHAQQSAFSARLRRGVQAKLAADAAVALAQVLQQ